MKILVIDPPFYRFIGYYNRYFPLGLTYLAAVLQTRGYEVMVYDADANINPSKMNFAALEESYPAYLTALRQDSHIVWQELKDRLDEFKPDAVGISVWTTFAASAFKIASICKEYNKNLPVIMGGPHISIKYDEVMNICKDVDFLVRREGEETLPELIKALESADVRSKNSVTELRGISYRKNGAIVHNPERPFINNLDMLPFPARNSLINKAKYNSEDMGLLMTSRGCPYACSYCATSIWGRHTRYRSVDNVISEMKRIIDEYQTKQFTFKDDLFTVNRGRVMELCDRLILEGLNIGWECNTRVNLVDEAMLRRMKKAGCNSIKVGIETGSEKIMGLINKKITFADCKKAAQLFRKVGIHWTGYFMMGFPGETKDDVYATVKFMKALKPDYASFSVYEPFPGTELFSLGIEKGLVQENRQLQDFFTISPKYYYVKDMNKRVDTMSKEEFEKLETEVKREFHTYNRGLTRIMKRIGSRSKIYSHSPKVIWEDFRKFLSWI
jgi:anaerobic magnesium-protoporphyrin IX monomethyl ester cyclase